MQITPSRIAGCIAVLVALNAPGAARGAGQITATPNFHELEPSQLGTSTISWSAYGSFALVTVSYAGRPEQTMYSGAPSGSVDAQWIAAPNRYVFKLYADSQKQTLLDTVSVQTKLPSNGGWGFNYWPNGYTSDALSPANWPSVKPQVEEDLDLMASLGAGYLRLMLWPDKSGYEIDVFGPPHFDAGVVGAFAANLLDLVELCEARGIRVAVVFANTYLTRLNSPCELCAPTWRIGYPLGTEEEARPQFHAESAAWIETFATAIQTSQYKNVVIYYDLNNESSGAQSYQADADLYVNAIYDAVGDTIPVGKRGLSLANVGFASPGDDEIHFATQLGVRRIDFVEFHSYPNGNNASPSPAHADVEAGVDALSQSDAFPNSVVVVGEVGRPSGGTEGESGQQTTLTDLAGRLLDRSWPEDAPCVPATAPQLASPVPWLANWGFWDYTPTHQYFGDLGIRSTAGPKDAWGAIGECFSAIPNSDFEQTGTSPPHFVADGIDLDLAELDPTLARWTGGAATNGSFARLTAAGESTIWLSSESVAVRPRSRVFASAYFRSSGCGTVRIAIAQYDGEQQQLPGSKIGADSVLPQDGEWHLYRLRDAQGGIVELDDGVEGAAVTLQAECDDAGATFDVDAANAQFVPHPCADGVDNDGDKRADYAGVDLNSDGDTSDFVLGVSTEFAPDADCTGPTAREHVIQTGGGCGVGVELAAAIGLLRLARRRVCAG
jgi:hypothetical protein